MFKFIKNLFKAKTPEKTDKELLHEQLVTTITSTASVKNPFYHEIVEEKGRFTVRIYERKTGKLVVNNVYETHSEAVKQSLDLLIKHNKGEA